jgi:hypothetical protein
VHAGMVTLHNKMVAVHAEMIATHAQLPTAQRRPQLFRASIITVAPRPNADSSMANG